MLPATSVDHFVQICPPDAALIVCGRMAAEAPRNRMRAGFFPMSCGEPAVEHF